MTSDHFFIARRDISGSRGRIMGAEHHHLGRVARLRPGDEVGLFDETGGRYAARIEKIGPDGTDVVILSAEAAAAPRVRLTLGQSVLKAKAMETVVQKATELGVSAIAPLLSRRSVVRPGRGNGSPVERWLRIARAAAKQSGSGRLPRIGEPVRMAAFLAEDRGGEKLVLTERGGTPLRDLLAGPGALRPDEATLVVGPEGGWDAAEEEEILASGFRAVSLGRAILRAETASLVAAGMALHFWDD